MRFQSVANYMITPWAIFQSTVAIPTPDISVAYYLAARIVADN